VEAQWAILIKLVLFARLQDLTLLPLLTCGVWLGKTHCSNGNFFFKKRKRKRPPYLTIELIKTFEKDRHVR
jgi:hypothetical protein